jgi:hypothetical protein
MPGTGLDETVDTAQQRRLSRAAEPDNADEFAAMNG